MYQGVRWQTCLNRPNCQAAVIQCGVRGISDSGNNSTDTLYCSSPLMCKKQKSPLEEGFGGRR